MDSFSIKLKNTCESFSNGIHSPRFFNFVEILSIYLLIEKFKYSRLRNLYCTCSYTKSISIVCKLRLVLKCNSHTITASPIPFIVFKSVKILNVSGTDVSFC